MWERKACGLYYKSLTILIYNPNDSGLYYKKYDPSNLSPS